MLCRKSHVFFGYSGFLLQEKLMVVAAEKGITNAYGVVLWVVILYIYKYEHPRIWYFFSPGQLDHQRFDDEQSSYNTKQCYKLVITQQDKLYESIIHIHCTGQNFQGMRRGEVCPREKLLHPLLYLRVRVTYLVSLWFLYFFIYIFLTIFFQVLTIGDS